MAVPGPPVSLAAVRAEFGAPAGTPLNAFVRGGAWVPNTAQNAAVPIAPPIRLASLAGAAAYQPVTATASPNPATGNGSGPNSSGVVYTGNITATGHGGHGSYTYAWSMVSGTASITNPNSATMQVNKLVFAGSPQTVTARCTVSDGASSNYVDVPITLTYTRE